MIFSERVETPLSSNIKLRGPVCSTQNAGSENFKAQTLRAENELCSQYRNMITHFYYYAQENIYLNQPREIG